MILNPNPDQNYRINQAIYDEEKKEKEFLSKTWRTQKCEGNLFAILPVNEEKMNEVPNPNPNLNPNLNPVNEEKMNEICFHIPCGCCFFRSFVI